MATFLSEIQTNWHHYFDNLEFSTNEFYSSVEASVRECKIPDVSFSRVKLSQAGLLSANREYLRITRKGQSFDVGAAPFARGFFISYWLGEKDAPISGLLTRIPVIGILFDKKKRGKTYFQMDTEAMYKEAVSGAIMEAVDKMTNAKSIRNLTEGDRLPKSIAR